MRVDNVQEAGDEGLWWRGAVVKDEVIVLNAVAAENVRVIVRIIESDHRRHPKVVKHVCVVVGAEDTAATNVFVVLVAWESIRSAEGNKLIRYNLLELTVQRGIVVLIFINIIATFTFVGTDPTKALHLRKSFPAVQQGQTELIIHKCRVTIWFRFSLGLSKFLPNVLGGHLLHQYHVSTDKESSIGKISYSIFNLIHNNFALARLHLSNQCLAESIDTAKIQGTEVITIRVIFEGLREN
mmetsp:Transcript_65775/g.176227  ORF Transcript_65775/g.176227 Transcript_65775/m.176227 type:complete len:240 (+) Transcript_65775:553-1272(+)